MTAQKKPARPAQAQPHQPGVEAEMSPLPQAEDLSHKGLEKKLAGKVALITGGDSGIGRAVAVLFAKEGADIAIVYLNEDVDALETKTMIESHGRKCLLFTGDVGEERVCRDAVERTSAELGRIDILVNNAGEQHMTDSIEEITADQLLRTFRANVFSFFNMTKVALPHLGEGSAIINTASVTAYKGNPKLLDYSSTKGAIVAFTRSLALQLIGRKIRVNAVAPGPIWTPLIPASFPPEKVESFGEQTPMGRAGEPQEAAPAYLFLASSDSSYMTGQTIHVNGGIIVNG